MDLTYLVDQHIPEFRGRLDRLEFTQVKLSLYQYRSILII